MCWRALLPHPAGPELRSRPDQRPARLLRVDGSADAWGRTPGDTVELCSLGSGDYKDTGKNFFLGVRFSVGDMANQHKLGEIENSTFIDGVCGRFTEQVKKAVGMTDTELKKMERKQELSKPLEFKFNALTGHPY